MGKFVDLSGRRYDRWLVLHRVLNGKRNTYWRCRCDCGNEGTIQGPSLVHGTSRSCGCLKNETTAARNMKHGMSKTPMHELWSGMLSRCRNPKHKGFANYGGRGITVCERWQSFARFLEDVGERPDGMTLERENTNGHYEPGNVIWATPKQQARNMRRNRIVSFRGQDLCVAELAELFNLSPIILLGRIKNGWDLEKAVAEPAQARGVSRRRMLSYNGLRMSVTEWSSHLGITASAIHARVRRGCPIEEVLQAGHFRTGPRIETSQLRQA